MKIDKEHLEILAPAGNMESLRAAVINGANAVYLGGAGFNARAKANNFDNESLKKAVEYCHLFNVKVYLTVNIILKPSEYDQAIELITYANSVGVDAFIIQDIAFIKHLHSTMPDIVVHLSTQAGIHNLEGALYTQSLGVSRIVLSRETSIEDIKKIKENTDLEIEYFIHGALCIAFSGNCYLSSMASGLSGNRGKCLQFCRKKYTYKKHNGYLLSAKDINMSDKISQLIDAGVTSFKIEGRMRRAEYVGGVVKHYSDILDGLQPNDNIIKRLFNRGNYCQAYLQTHTPSIVYPFIQGHIGQKIGNVEKVFQGKANLKLTKKLNEGDGLKFIRNNVEVGSASVSQTGYQVGFSGNVKPGDEVFITTDNALMKEISSRERKIDVELFIYHENNKLILNATYLNETILITSDEIAIPAQNKPISENDLFDCFSKTGDSEFALKSLVFDCFDNIFIPKSKLNEFRRNVYSTITNDILSKYNERQNDEKHQNCLKNRLKSTQRNDFSWIATNKNTSIVQIDDISLYEKLDNFDYIAYYPTVYNEKVIEDMSILDDRGILVLPIIARDSDLLQLKTILASEKIKNVIINNAYGYEIAKGKNILLGIGMNAINPNYENCIMSIEYDGKNYQNNFAYVYGYNPVMTFAHCPKITLNGKCEHCDGQSITYTDENSNDFLMRNYRINNRCYWQMHNCVPISALSSLDKFEKIFVDLVGTPKNEIENVLDSVKTRSDLIQNKTKGYFNKKLQ